MSKFALIGHSYHRITGSSNFFQSILERLGQVSRFWDDPKEASVPYWFSSFCPSEYDIIIIWQWSRLLEERNGMLAGHKNVIVVPMYDHVINSSRAAWTAIYSTFRILCFSSTLYLEVKSEQRDTAFFRFFPNPSAFPAKVATGDFSAYFWQRCDRISERSIRGILAETTFDRLTLHAHSASTPHLTPELPACQVFARERCNVPWFERRQEYLQHLAEHDVFIAPRLYEGIGMSFLEAMAIGLCVVAPNTATHNEYIDNGRTGILYENEAIQLTTTLVRSVGLRAREAVFRGYAEWEKSIPELIRYIDK